MLKNGLLSFSFVFLALCFGSGCATLIDGGTQPVNFKSSPEGATVTVNGEIVGKTPSRIVLDRQSESIVEISKEGYAKHTIKMESRMNGLVFVNLIWCLSCILSTTTDYASGAAYHYDPDKYFVILVPEGVTETPSDTKKRQVKSLIMGNYTEILTELSKIPDDPTSYQSYGEYLDSLITMIEIPEPDRPEAIGKVKTISQNTKNSLTFSDEVINALIP